MVVLSELKPGSDVFLGQKRAGERQKQSLGRSNAG